MEHVEGRLGVTRENPWDADDESLVTNDLTSATTAACNDEKMPAPSGSGEERDDEIDEDGRDNNDNNKDNSGKGDELMGKSGDNRGGNGSEVRFDEEGGDAGSGKNG